MQDKIEKNFYSMEWSSLLHKILIMTPSILYFFVTTASMTVNYVKPFANKTISPCPSEQRPCLTHYITVPPCQCITIISLYHLSIPVSLYQLMHQCSIHDCTTIKLSSYNIKAYVYCTTMS